MERTLQHTSFGSYIVDEINKVKKPDENLKAAQLAAIIIGINERAVDNGKSDSQNFDNFAPFRIKLHPPYTPKGKDERKPLLMELLLNNGSAHKPFKNGIQLAQLTTDEKTYRLGMALVAVRTAVHKVIRPTERTQVVIQGPVLDLDAQ